MVNRELNFHSQDSNLVIRGGCDLFTTKPIGSDKKLYKRIDKHIDQIMEDNQLSKSVEREFQNMHHVDNGINYSLSVNSGSLGAANNRRNSSVEDTGKLRRPSLSLAFSRNSASSSYNQHSNFVKSLPSDSMNDEKNSYGVDPAESPFGPLQNTTTRKTFAYLIGILNSTYPDHDFSNLQPTTENFHKLNTAEELIHRFNNIMVSLGKKEDLLNWIWDTVNVYMDFLPSKLFNGNSMTGSTHSGLSYSIGPYRRTSLSSGNESPTANNFASDNCQIYEFQPSDQSILEDLNYPYQTMWSYYWFIYNKRKKRVSFIYLTALNGMHYKMVNGGRSRSLKKRSASKSHEAKAADEEDNFYVDDDYAEDVSEEASTDDNMEESNDVLGDLEI